MPRLQTAIKIHGGKNYEAADLARIAAKVLTETTNVVETHAGGASFSLHLASLGHRKAYILNDTDRLLTNFWNVLGSPKRFEEFRRLAEATPFGRRRFRQAQAACDAAMRPTRADPELALEFFVLCRQSLSGQRKGFTGITTTRLRRGMQEQVSAWLTAVDGLPAIHAIIREWLIYGDDALECIDGCDDPFTLFYLDPPYLHETRATTGEYGEGEMSPEEHRALLEKLATIAGKFMISGYRSELYDDYAATYGWARHDIKRANSAAGGKKKKVMTECVWCNF